MKRHSPAGWDYKTVELNGVRYAIVPDTVFRQLCRQAGVELPGGESPEPAEPDFPLDGVSLAEKLVRRRQAAGLSQAELARRAGVRPETLNRIERGRTTPDFATIRKLVVAMDAAEQAWATRSITSTTKKESKHGNRSQAK